MKTKWEKWKNAWWEFWGIYENDDNSIVRFETRKRRKSLRSTVAFYEHMC